MRLWPATTLMLLVIGLGGGTAAVSAQQQHDAHGGAVLTPEQLTWQDGPPSLPAGAQFVVVEGDPSKADYFAMRLRLPDGYRIPPHWHPVHERVTVISGVFHLGRGETFDATRTEPLEAGSYFTMPPKSRHFAHADGETVIQLNSIGPWEIHYVDPTDDPRRRH
jgi:quercetin dioxygenase-like cupin family protein